MRCRVVPRALVRTISESLRVSRVGFGPHIPNNGARPGHQRIGARCLRVLVSYAVVSPVVAGDIQSRSPLKAPLRCVHADLSVGSYTCSTRTGLGGLDDLKMDAVRGGVRSRL